MTAKGLLFVVLQFSAIAVLLSYSSFLPFKGESLLQLAAVAIGLSAIWAIRKSKLSVFPELKNDATLVKNGPYAMVRHPMYSAVLLFCLPAISFGFIPMVFYLVLLVTLILKMKYEESILNREFDGYSEYAKNTKRLIPYVY